MKFEDALKQMMENPAQLHMTTAALVSERKCHVRSQGHLLALRLVNFKTKLAQDWVPTPDHLLDTTWEVLPIQEG